MRMLDGRGMLFGRSKKRATDSLLRKVAMYKKQKGIHSLVRDNRRLCRLVDRCTPCRVQRIGLSGGSIPARIINVKQENERHLQCMSFDRHKIQLASRRKFDVFYIKSGNNRIGRNGGTQAGSSFEKPIQNPPYPDFHVTNG
jgi:hypothetical protein